MNELWVDCKCWNNHQVSNLGRVRSIDHIIFRKDGQIRHIKGQPIRTHINSAGYITCSGGIFLHRLLAEAFIPNPYNLPCVNHKDENKLNNSLDNLEWCSYSYNNSYGTKREKLSTSMKLRLSNPKNHPMYGRTHSDEAKRKISERNKGKPSPCGFRGKHHSETTRQLISEKVKLAKRMDDYE